MVLSITVLGQHFEGTLVWSVKTEVTDPKMKQQMAEAQKAMSDPAKIKEMEDQLNNPEFKKMMDQNPQMKAQMEKALAMMKSSGAGESMMPKKIIIQMKNESAHTRMEGGMMAGTETLYLGDKKETITLNRDAKTYSKHADDTKEEENNDDLKSKVTKTSTTAKILGYTCTKYIVTSTYGDKAIETIIWATKDIKDLDFKALAAQQKISGKQANFFPKDIDGVPLKVETNSSGIHMVMEATELKRETIPASEFAIPAGFTEVKGGF